MSHDDTEITATDAALARAVLGQVIGQLLDAQTTHSRRQIPARAIAQALEGLLAQTYAVLREEEPDLATPARRDLARETIGAAAARALVLVGEEDMRWLLEGQADASRRRASRLAAVDREERRRARDEALAKAQAQGGGR
jgi:hypothetical protein